jgi:Zn-dependent protease with chaperone function
MKLENNSEPKIFSQHKLNILAAENAGKILILILIAIFSIGLFFDKDFKFLIKLLFVSGFLFFLFYIANRFIKKFIKEIIIHTDEKKIGFSLYRVKNMITAQPDKIEAINRQGYITFKINGNKYFYNGIIDEKLLSSLKRINVKVKHK